MGQAAQLLTIQIFWSSQVNDTMDHFPSILPKLPQVLAQRLIVQPLLQNKKRYESLFEASRKYDAIAALQMLKLHSFKFSILIT